MRVIIAGGRDFNDYQFLKGECLKILRQLKSEGYNTKRENVTIVSGKARGADTLGEKFQKEFELGIKEFPADWSIGRQAGYIRNNSMAEYAKQDEELGILIAFWDKKSKGTKHMIDLANKHGLGVFVVNYC